MNITKAWAAYCGTDEYRVAVATLPSCGPEAAGAMFMAFAAGFRFAAQESAVAVEQYSEGFKGAEVVEFAAEDIRKLGAAI